LNYTRQLAVRRSKNTPNIFGQTAGSGFPTSGVGSGPVSVRVGQ
jgi:hypothetical protein